MKRRRHALEQGSMLSLMEVKSAPRAREPEVAITRLDLDGESQTFLGWPPCGETERHVTRMVHEPVQDPLDDPEEYDAFVAYYGDYHG